MKTLKQYIELAEKRQAAVGHFNVSDLAGLKGVFSAARKLKAPIIIGASENERRFWGTRQIAALIKSLREEYRYPIFLNADHTTTLEGVKEAAQAGFDAIHFDASELPFQENIKQTKKAVLAAKKINPAVLIEAELGRIGGASMILKDRKRFSVQKSGLTDPEEVLEFVQQTGADLLAPSIGNIHGRFSRGFNPKIDLALVRKIKNKCSVPLVLHGGSGSSLSEIKSAVKAGISVVHINTELRLVWRKSLESALRKLPKEIVPYKILAMVEKEISRTVERYLKIF